MSGDERSSWLPGCFTPRKEPRYLLKRRLDELRTGFWNRRFLAPAGTRTPDRPGHSGSLYRLSYPAAIIVSRILNRLLPYTCLNLRLLSCVVLKLMDPEGVLGAELRHFAESHGRSFNWMWGCRSQQILLFFLNYILERNNWKWWLQPRWEDASFFHLPLSPSCNRCFYISQEADWPGKFRTTEPRVSEMWMLSDFLNCTLIGLETFLASCLSTSRHILRMYFKNLLRTNSVKFFFCFLAHTSRDSYSPSTRRVNVLQQWPSSALSSSSLPPLAQLFLTDYSRASQIINWRTCCEKRHIEPSFTK
jgi:hypothetical protein